MYVHRCVSRQVQHKAKSSAAFALKYPPECYIFCTRKQTGILYFIIIFLRVILSSAVFNDQVISLPVNVRRYKCVDPVGRINV